MAKLVRSDHINEPVVNHIRKNFVRVMASDRVADALDRVQHSPVEGRVVYFYVVDEENRLQGVVPTRRLLLSPPETPVTDIMARNVISLPSSATLLDACEFFTFHRLLALPVVDQQRHMLGVVDVEVYTDEISDLAERQESESVFQLIGVRLAELRLASIPTVFRIRFPWLLCNIAGGLACAFLAAWHEQVLANVVILAMFIPILLTLAESASIQSLTLTLQAHHGGRLQWKKLVSPIAREAMIGGLLGLCCGALVGLVVWIWQGPGLVGLCISLSIALAVTIAALFGLVVPTALHALQRDPKAASGPIVLAMTDVTAMFCYLGLAALMLR